MQTLADFVRQSQAPIRATTPGGLPRQRGRRRGASSPLRDSQRSTTPSVSRRQRFDTLVGVATIALREKRSPAARPVADAQGFSERLSVALWFVTDYPSRSRSS